MVRNQQTTAKQSYRWAFRLVQAGISLALIIWLLAGISWREVLAILVNAHGSVIAVACALYYVGVILSCLKWALALRVESTAAPFPRLVRWYLIGAFVSNFLPTDIGGDLGRGFYASRFTGKMGAVARSIFVERLTGLAAMGVLAIASLPVIDQKIASGIVIAALIMALLAVTGILAGRAGSATRPQIAGFLNKVYDSGMRYVHAPDTMAVMLILSLAFQTLAGAGVWLNMLAVGVDLPFLTVVPIAALVGLIGLLPVSISGWGVREVLIVTLLTPLGAPADRVLAGALLGRFLILVVTLAGGVLLWLEPGIQHSTSRVDWREK